MAALVIWEQEIAGSEGYSSQQGQSFRVCIMHMLVWESEWTSASLVMWACQRESERASFMCRLYPFLRTECSSDPAGQSSAPCDSSALLFGYGAWQLTSTTNTQTHTHTVQTAKAFLSTGLLLTSIGFTCASLCNT